MTTSPSPNRRAFGGLLQCRLCWLPTWRGWTLLASCLVGITFALVYGAYPFFAICEPVESNVLVVEGWGEDYAMEFAVAQFHSRKCASLYVTGVPITKGSFLVEYKTFADLGAATLRKLGVPSDAVVAVPTPVTQTDRTYLSVVALRVFFDAHGGPPKSFNVITVGAHARRSRWIFRRVFGADVNVGVIAVPNAYYEPRRWWRSSMGLRDMIGEALACLYAIVLPPGPHA